MDIDLFFAEHPMSIGSRKLYRPLLERFARAVDPAACTAGDVLRWLDGTGWGSSLRWIAVGIIRRYLCWEFGPDHPGTRVKIKREKTKPGRVLNHAQVGRLLAAFNTSSRKGRRDLAICCLALDTGLRVAELASARYSDLDMIERSQLVKVKGGSWATAVFSEQTGRELAAWLPCRKAGDDRLFQVTRDGLCTIVKRWGEALGYRLSPHDLRRTFCVLSLRAGAPSRLVQVAGRWSSLDMVEHYSQAITPSDFEAYFPVARVLNDNP